MAAAANLEPTEPAEQRAPSDVADAAAEAPSQPPAALGSVDEGAVIMEPRVPFPPAPSAAHLAYDDDDDTPVSSRPAGWGEGPED